MPRARTSTREEDDPVEDDRSEDEVKASISAGSAHAQQLQRKRKSPSTPDTPGKKKATTKKSPAAPDPRDLRIDTNGALVKPRPGPIGKIKERLKRVLGIDHGREHRFLLIDTRQLAPVGSETGAAQEFQVLSFSSGNVYECVIGRHLSCSCEDFQKNGKRRLGRDGKREGKPVPCKHLLFCYIRCLKLGDPTALKVLCQPRGGNNLDEGEHTGNGSEEAVETPGSQGGSQDSQATPSKKRPHTDSEHFILWQTVLTINEADAVLGRLGDGALETLSTLANARLRLQYAQLTGRQLAHQAPSTNGAERKPAEGDCPICLAPLVETDPDLPKAGSLTWCGMCGQNCHEECMTAWTEHKSRQSCSVHCVVCRMPWQPGDAEPQQPQTEVRESQGKHVVNLLPSSARPDLHQLYPHLPSFAVETMLERHRGA